MTTPQLPPLPEPARTMWQHGKQIDHYTADQMRAYALAALSTRPVSESIHAENARTLQAFVDELREMLGVKEGESLKDAVRALSASAAQAGWQPIETAPKGQLVLLWATRGSARCVIDDWGDFDRYNHPRITHWMPLPPAPIKKEQEA